MDKREMPRVKKAYSSPELTVYGTVEDLTRDVGRHSAKDNGSAPGVRTAV